LNKVGRREVNKDTKGIEDRKNQINFYIIFDGACYGSNKEKILGAIMKTVSTLVTQHPQFMQACFE
jgi:hypothetical protein